jgi:pimeloyl-ACP methyl ester carboxylesterase
MFPGRARAMVLDSPVDAATWRDRPLETWREQGVAFENTLDRFFAACAAHQDRCGFGGDDPEAAFGALVDRLDRVPLPAPDPASDSQPVDGDEVRLATNDAMYDPSFWAPLAAALAQAETGDGSLVRQLAAAAINDRVSPTINRFFANNAVDQTYPDDVETLAQEGRHGYGLFEHFWAEAAHINFVAGRWPVQSRDVFDGDFHNPDDATPIVIIGGTHDPATPYQWAERLAIDLGNARLITYESDGHGASNDLNPCVLGPVLTYLVDGATLPPDGLVCEQELEPFPA